MSGNSLTARAIYALLLAIAVFAASKLIIRSLPGDPLDTLIAESGTTIPREQLRQDLRLDEPFVPALARDLAATLRGDFGVSLITKQPLGPQLRLRFWRSFSLAALAMSLALVASLAMALAAVARPGGFADRFVDVHGALAAALPLPWIAPMSLFVLAAWIPIFPVGGHALLPALTLAASFSGGWSRLVRERVRETLADGAAPGARARGLSEFKVLIKYGLAPAAGALAAYIGTQFGGLLAGSFVAEVVFNWQGLGTFVVDAVMRRDYPAVEATIFVGALASLGGTLCGDIAQRVLDPRLKERA